MFFVEIQRCLPNAFLLYGQRLTFEKNPSSFFHFIENSIQIALLTTKKAQL